MSVNTNPLNKIVFIKRVCLFIPFNEVSMVDLQAQRNETTEENLRRPIVLASVCQSWRETMVYYNGAAEIWTNLNREYLKQNSTPMKDLIHRNRDDDDDVGSDVDVASSFEDDEEEEEEEEYYGDEDYAAIAKAEKEERKLNKNKIKSNWEKIKSSYEWLLPANILFSRLLTYFDKRIKEIRLRIRKFEQSNVKIERNSTTPTERLPTFCDLGWMARSLLRSGAHPMGYTNFERGDSHLEACCRVGCLEVLQAICEEAPKIYSSSVNDDESDVVNNNNNNNNNYNFFIDLDILFCTDEDRYGGRKIKAYTSAYTTPDSQYSIEYSSHNPLWVAIHRRHFHIVEWLIRDFLPKEILQKIINRQTDKWNEGATCLLAAIYNHDIDLVKMLVEEGGADPHQIVEHPRGKWLYGQTDRVLTVEFCPLTPTIACFKNCAGNITPFEKMKVVTKKCISKKDGEETEESELEEEVFTPTSFCYNYLYHPNHGKRCCQGIDMFELLVKKYNASPNGLENKNRDYNTSRMVCHEATARYRKMMEERLSSASSHFNQDQIVKQSKQFIEDNTLLSHTWVYTSYTPFLMACACLAKSQQRNSSGKIIRDTQNFLEEDQATPALTTFWTIKKLIDEYGAQNHEEEESLDTRAIVRLKGGDDFTNAFLLAITAENYETVKYFLEEFNNDDDSNKTKLVDVYFTNKSGDNGCGFAVLCHDLRISRLVSKVLWKN